MNKVFLFGLLSLTTTACSFAQPNGLSTPTSDVLNDGKIAYVLEAVNDTNKISKLIVSAPNGQSSRTVFQGLGNIYAPAWSPDGKLLAFSVQRPKGLAVIYLMFLENPSSPVLLTPFKSNNLSPSFSPDGQSILFSSSLDGDSDIYRLNLSRLAGNDKSQLEKIIDLPSTEVQPSYAPDGKSFVFVSDKDTAGKPQIYLYNFADSKTTALTHNQYSASPSLNPTADKIGFLNGTQASIMDLNSQLVTNIANTGLDEAPRFSPDGSRVIYASRQGNDYRINIQNLSTGEVSYFSTDGKVRSPVWSK